MDEKGAQRIENADGEPVAAVNYEDEVFEWREVIRGMDYITRSELSLSDLQAAWTYSVGSLALHTSG